MRKEPVSCFTREMLKLQLTNKDDFVQMMCMQGKNYTLLSTDFV